MPADALAGRLCLITGAGSGIGAAIARRFAGEGAVVVAVDLDLDAVHQVASGLPGAEAVQADVSAEADVARVFEQLERAPDVLVNVAGIGSTTTAPDTPTDVWEQVFAVNARGTFLFCKYAIPGMAALPDGGSIVNMASVAGLVGLRNRAAYCASKGAVIALTRALAVDHVADGIRVNCICPGTIDSPWVRRLVDEVGESLDALRARQPMGRLGSPAEVAESALYLASPASSFVTGSSLVIDGGLTAA
jgi:NAD(P)-dependent dehydrogenase (short-subunit alcohol dehydrogenase family)